jgi:thiol-disulfide isomerase/thioredoxin
MKTLLAVLASLSLATATLAAGTKGAAPAHVSQGQEIKLSDYAVPGKITVFDFTSKYCGPCQVYNEPLAKLHAQRPDIAIVKVDINRPDVKRIDWQSPVAKQYGLQSIPHFKVYGPDGKLVAEDKIIFGPDGRPASNDAKARQMVDRYIAALK